MRHSDTSIVRSIAKHVATISNRLRPPCHRCVLSTDSAARRQHRRATPSRHVEDDADVAPIAERPRARKRTRCSIFKVEPKREHQRTRSVVDADAVMLRRELKPEQDLTQLMPASGKLIENLAFGKQSRFFDVIQRAGREHQPRYAVPVHGGERSEDGLREAGIGPSAPVDRRD